MALHVREVLCTAAIAVAGLAAAQENKPAPQPAPSSVVQPTPQPGLLPVEPPAKASTNTTDTSATRLERKPNAPGRSERRRIPSPRVAALDKHDAPVTQSVPPAEPTTTTTTNATTSTTATPRKQPSGAAPTPLEIRNDPHAHTPEFSLTDAVRRYGPATGAVIFGLIAAIWAITYGRKQGWRLWRKPDDVPAKTDDAEDFLLWAKLVVCQKAGTAADDDEDDITLLSRAAQSLPQLTADEQRAITESFFDQWARRHNVSVQPEDVVTALTLGAAALGELRRAGRETDVDQKTAATHFETLLNAEAALADERNNAEAQQIKAKKPFDDALEQTRAELSEARSEVTKQINLAKELEAKLGTENKARQAAEKTSKEFSDNLTKTSSALTASQKLVSNFDTAKAAYLADAETARKEVNQKLSQATAERDEWEKKHRKVSEDLTKAKETIVLRDGTIKSLTEQGAKNAEEIKRIAAGMRTAASLEALQWIGQRRFAHKVDDASISSVFVMVGYMAAYQYLRGIVENDRSLQDLGVINLRTLLEKISAIAESGDWKKDLRNLVPEAFEAAIANENATMAGLPQPEQLLFLSVLNHMAALSGDRIDNRTVRVSPLFYRTAENAVRGVR